VSSSELLPLYRAIRNSIDAIRELATNIEGDVGRVQIYRESDAIHLALERMQSLTAAIQLLESQLHSCARSQANAQTCTVKELSPTRAAA
jgi:archaellum component FlaC